MDEGTEFEAYEERLRAILNAAFAGPPTEFKDIPTRAGKRRSIGRGSVTPGRASLCAEGLMVSPAADGADKT